MAYSVAMINKDEFTRFLLSRFIHMDEWSKYHLISCLTQADAELCHDVIHNDAEITSNFDEWVKTISESIFPELMGDLQMGPGLDEFKKRIQFRSWIKANEGDAVAQEWDRESQGMPEEDWGKIFNSIVHRLKGGPPDSNLPFNSD